MSKPISEPQPETIKREKKTIYGDPIGSGNIINNWVKV